MVSSLSVLQDPQFSALSVSAQHWLNMTEVRVQPFSDGKRHVPAAGTSARVTFLPAGHATSRISTGRS